MTLIEGFTDWMSKSFRDHPIYTITFGAACFLIGFLI